MARSAPAPFAAEGATPLPPGGACEEQHPTGPAGLGEISAGIDKALRDWRGARHRGQSVLTELSNTLLLRTYIDKGGRSGVGGAVHVGAGGAHVWGALARAGAVLPNVSIAAEARARQLHSELGILQGVMLAAAADVQRFARHARSLALGGVESVSDDLDASLGGGYRVSDVADVADVAAEVAGMLLKEVLMTATVTQGVAGSGSRDALTMYAAAWMMEPYVDASRVKDLQTLVSGVRSLKSK